jgi:hypothetical protein
MFYGIMNSNHPISSINTTQCPLYFPLYTVGTVKGCCTVQFVLCSVSSTRNSNTVAVSFLQLLLYLYCEICLQFAFSNTEWIQNSCLPQYPEAGAQGLANSKDVEYYSNGHVKEVE